MYFQFRFWTNINNVIYQKDEIVEVPEDDVVEFLSYHGHRGEHVFMQADGSFGIQPDDYAKIEAVRSILQQASEDYKARGPKPAQVAAQAEPTVELVTDGTVRTTGGTPETAKAPEATTPLPAPPAAPKAQEKPKKPTPPKK